MRILVMAGTSDATRIIKFLHEDENNFIIATTITDYGADIAKKAGANETISKALKIEDFSKLIEEKNIELLIDATHPFAKIATQTAIKTTEKTNIKYIRFERPNTILPKNKNIIKVKDFQEANITIKKLLTKKEDKIMHLAGVMTLPSIVKEIPPEQIIVRVLPNNFSITKTLENQIPPENIIAMQGTYSEKLNKAILEEYNTIGIITKESGNSGGAENKINAALALNKKVILVTRPYIQELENKIIVHSIEDLKNSKIIK
ncbi:MAG: precorrin-6A reductase [Methanobacteriaceae archaeon]|nr:precorrin-6A reductase [Methanobacteriaceae archaeon]